MSEQAFTRLCDHIESQIGQILDLPESGSWPATKHKLDAPSARAIVAAVAAGRPLLVRGEPGVGKSQLARAAAKLLDRPFMATVIQPDSEYQELLWAMDHTKRLADAQLGKRERVGDDANYIGPGALWWALNLPDAADQASRCRHNFYPPKGIDPEHVLRSGAVLLIDEIDKADISLANGLLEVLGNRSFEVSPLGKSVKADAHPQPLVVLTSNDTRQLPAALLRRCVVLRLRLPTNANELHAHCVAIGRAHFDKMDERVLAQAAAQIQDDRSLCKDGARTGLAEYLDLLRALHRVARGDTDRQLAWLKKLGRYFAKSHDG